MGEPRLRAVVFDFDGVILESADLKTDAFVELFGHLSDDRVEAVRAHHLANTGISRFAKFAWIYRNLLGREVTDAESLALGERFSAIALEKVLACPFVAGARDALAVIGARLPIFIASGTPQEELDLVVERRGLAGLFREVWGSPAEKPAILRGIVERHGLAPAEVLFVGDGTSDHAAALATSVEFLARDTPALHEEWTRRGVRRVEDLRTLPELVVRW